MKVFYVNEKKQLKNVEVEKDHLGNLSVYIADPHLIISVMNDDYSFKPLTEVGDYLKENELRYFSADFLHNGVLFIQNEVDFHPNEVRYLAPFIDVAPVPVNPIEPPEFEGN